jgi:hypothetical protein
LSIFRRAGQVVWSRYCVFFTLVFTLRQVVTFTIDPVSHYLSRVDATDVLSLSPYLKDDIVEHY